MKADKLILVALAAIVLVKFFAAFPLDNSTLPGGTDVAHFLTNTWYIAKYGMTKWNYFWYGGFPFMRYYPPLAFLITGGVAKVIGVLLAYKLVNDLFMVLVPVAFYFFLREFKLSREKELMALLTFSFIPIFSYFLADGRFPTLINVFFALLYWKFLKRSLDSKRFVDVGIASIFLSLSMITHHTTTLLFILISSAWALIYKMEFETVKKLIYVSILTLAITAWWSGPFFLETLTTNNSNLYLRSVGEVYVGNLVYRIKTSVLENNFYTSTIEPYAIISLAVLIGGIGLLALKRYKDKTTRDFIFLSIFIVIMILLVRYERSVIFIAIPLAFIVAEGLGELKKNVRLIVSGIFVLVLVTAYLLIRPQVFSFPSYPNIPKDGRVIFFPIGSAYQQTSDQVKNYYSVIVSPMNGQENIFGWHDESQLVGDNAAVKVNYLNEIRDPFSLNKSTYYELLDAGYINYVVVNKNDTQALNYFNDTLFKEISTDNMFISYQINPESTYVEFNGIPVASNVTKSQDMITIDTVCQSGSVTIKESYHKMWNAEINGGKTQVSFNDYGFIELNSSYNGNCRIVLSYKDPSYYIIFYAISFAAMAFVFISLLFNTLKAEK